MSFASPFRAAVWPAVVAVLTICFLTARAGQDASPATIPLRLIVVNSAAEAEKLQEQLKSGADFAVMAREKSVDATSLDGGFLGNVDPTTLRAELRDALQGLERGRISRVFKLPAGSAIRKALDRGEVWDRENREKARRTAISAEGSGRFDFSVFSRSETS